MGGSSADSLIFDFDGTLYHLPVDHDAVRRELGIGPHEKLGPLLQTFIDSGNAAGLAVVTRHECASVPAGSFTPGARACLARPGRTAIVTRNSRQAVLAALGELADGIVIVGREDVRRLKPDPEGVLLALSRLETEPADAVLIGDTYHDVDAARAAGVYSVIVRNQSLEYAPQGADRYVDRLGPELWNVTAEEGIRRNVK
jgi:HAD superfamily hydrolase (TIGR01509 family)